MFSKPIAADVKYSSFKTEHPLPLEDGVLSVGPVQDWCIDKSKYNVATYKETVPLLRYAEKVYLIKNLFVPEKDLCFPETIRFFQFDWLLLLPWFCYSPS